MVNKEFKYKENPEYLNDSWEEEHFLWFLLELKELGVITDVRKGESIEMIPSVTYFQERLSKKGKLLKPIEKTLLGNLSYTPDFVIKINEESPYVKLPFIQEWLFNQCQGNDALDINIEIKPDYNLHGVSTREFSIRQKVLFYTQGIYVNKIIPEHFFEKTFVPKRYLFTDMSRKPRKIKFRIKTLEEYVSQFIYNI